MGHRLTFRASNTKIQSRVQRKPELPTLAAQMPVVHRCEILEFETSEALRSLGMVSVLVL